MTAKNDALFVDLLDEAAPSIEVMAAGGILALDQIFDDGLHPDTVAAAEEIANKK